MHQRIKITIGLVVVIAITATAGAIVNAGAADSSPEVRTFKLAMQNRGGGFVDNPPRYSSKRQYDSPGDFAVLAGPITNSDGSAAGKVNGVITTLHATKKASSEQLSGTFVLPDGQITVHGVFASNSKTDLVAITGGTGNYRGVTGEVTSVGTEKEITFTVSISR